MKTTWSKEGLKYFQKAERTWQEAYNDEKEMRVLINGWERWVPNNNLKKGKELLSTNWTIIEMMNKKLGQRGTVVRMKTMTVGTTKMDIIRTSTMMWRICRLNPCSPRSKSLSLNIEKIFFFFRACVRLSPHR